MVPIGTQQWPPYGKLSKKDISSDMRLDLRLVSGLYYNVQVHVSEESNIFGR